MLKNKLLRGIPVSEGYGIGKALVFENFTPVVPDRIVSEEEKDAELNQLHAAIHAASDEIHDLLSRCGDSESVQAKILRVHLDILEDHEMLERMEDSIQNDANCCKKAVWDVYSEIISVLVNSGGDEFSERAADMKDVRNRILRCCEGKQAVDLFSITQPVVLIASDLAPSDTANLPQDKIIAIAAEYGGQTSHTAILARSVGIPAVLGVPGLTSAVGDGEEVIVDAVEGIVISRPDELQRTQYAGKRRMFLDEQAVESEYAKQPATLADGTRIITEINIGSVEDARRCDAEVDGVGLLRTEFLYMGAEHLPDEELQFSAYASILKSMNGKPVILRTLDIGGDKSIPYMQLPKEKNPFLGLRALRFCLANEPLFRTQLRAAYRASVYGDLWIMFPMVGSLEDFRKAKAICLSVQKELSRENISFNAHVPLGIMIEIPSIALAADLAAKETDFASIGTNDLCQYTCAADRLNASVSDYYRNTDPGLLRLIRYTAKCYLREGKQVGVCGELAGNPETAKLLVGLGIRRLSMAPQSIGRVRKALNSITLNDAIELAENAVTRR